MKYLSLFFVALWWPLAGNAVSFLDEIAGRIIAQNGDRRVELPLLESAVRVNIEGDMATVELRQTFSNPSEVPLEAEYLFPLNQHAAVFGMTMKVGDELIQAIVQEKIIAEATYKEAAADGKAAVLLTQHRPNMFTQKIANLMPGLPVEVTLKYVQMVPKIDGQYELVVPLIVGPRYQAPMQTETDVEIPETHATWSVDPLPAYPAVTGVDLPISISKERVSLAVNMISGVAVSEFASPTHPIEVAKTAQGLTAGFSDGKVLDNKDLILRYILGGDTLQAATLSHHDERGGFLSVMIEPPTVPEESVATPRELVFVLDTSGSMSGQPMAASKRFMDAALQGLRPNDYFRIIPFSNTASRFADGSTPATGANIRRGRHFVGQLSTGGGTEIDNAMRDAFASRPPENVMRIVVFLSDGYIGNEARVLRTIRQQIGDARIYAFGVGNSVNRYLLDAMADEGRGYARYVGVDENAVDVAEVMAANLQTPLLTDLEIDWGDLEVSEVTRTRLPDVFAGNTLRVYARYSGKQEGQITLKGLVQGRPASMPIDVVLADHDGAPALPLIWARKRIAMMERRIAVNDRPEHADKQITALGLEYGLQTRNTSFVAVSQKVVNQTGQTTEQAQVPLPMASGVGNAAYSQGFAGSSSPEPEAMLSTLMLLAMAALGLRTRRRVRRAV